MTIDEIDVFRCRIFYAMHPANAALRFLRPFLGLTLLRPVRGSVILDKKQSETMCKPIGIRVERTPHCWTPHKQTQKHFCGSVTYLHLPQAAFFGAQVVRAQKEPEAILEEYYCTAAFEIRFSFFFPPI